MANVSDIQFQSVPVSQFDKGNADQIFDRLHTEKGLVVLKNSRPTAVLLSVKEYIRLMEIEEDCMLLLEAERRLKADGGLRTIPFQDVLHNLGICETELNDTDEEII